MVRIVVGIAAALLILLALGAITTSLKRPATEKTDTAIKRLERPPPTSDSRMAEEELKARERRAAEELKRLADEAAARARSDAVAKRMEDEASIKAALAREEAKRRADEAAWMAALKAREEAQRKAAIEAEAKRAEAEKWAKDAVPTMGTAKDGVFVQAGHDSTKHAEDLRSVSGCPTGSPCTDVPVFFGTDREQTQLPHRIDFGSGRAQRLQLGLAVVTVPRSNRKVGQVTTPGSFYRAMQHIGLMPPQGDKTRHFTIVPSGVIVFQSEDQFLSAVRDHIERAGEFKNHAFVFVHGYNTTFEYALYRVAQIAYDLAGQDGKPFGTPFLYSWPSAGVTKDYIYDAESAQFAVGHLREFLKVVTEKTGAEHVHLIAHSMGTRPLLTVLDEMAKSATTPKTINQVILAAADYDAKQFLDIAQRITGIAKAVTLYASANDLALKASREAHRGLVRAGDVPDGGPVIVAGVDTIDVSAISTEVLATGHSEYAEKRELLNDIALLLQAGTRPPHKRAPMLRSVPVDKGIYWRVQQ